MFSFKTLVYNRRILSREREIQRQQSRIIGTLEYRVLYTLATLHADRAIIGLQTRYDLQTCCVLQGGGAKIEKPVNARRNVRVDNGF